MDEHEILDRLQQLEIETPSWGYGNSGTRFHVYPWPGAARDVYERIADAGLVHRLTGCCPSVAVHIPWDAVDDYGALGRFAQEQGVRIGAVNPNLFGDDAYRDPRAIDVHIHHLREKLEERPEQPALIVTVRGAGYRPQPP